MQANHDEQKANSTSWDKGPVENAAVISLRLLLVNLEICSEHHTDYGHLLW